MPPRSRASRRRLSSLALWQRLALTVFVCAGTTLLAMPLQHSLDAPNIVMLFLLAVVLVAVGLGLKPALLAAFLNVGLFDFFFVPPRFTLVVSNAQYLVTFTVMLVVAIIAGKLTADLRQQADDSALEAERTRALYELARDLSGALTLEQVVDFTNQFLRRVLAAEATMLLADGAGQLQAGPGNATRGRPYDIEPHLALMAYRQGKPVGCEQLAGSRAVLYLPLKAPMRMRGVIAVSSLSGAPQHLIDQRQRLETMASLAAIAIERVHYVDVAQRSQVEIASERLRSSILSALSHDLRTPLTALVGLADSLAESFTGTLTEARRENAGETAAAIREQAERLAGLVGNLLDMARLHAGKVTLRKEWQPVEEVIGTSIKLLGRVLAEHPVRVALADGLPLVEFDAVLIERVFCNLLENAAKYSPAATAIEIAVRTLDGQLEVCVSDHGRGFRDDGTDVFAMFVRGEAESALPGVGLGLAICRAIVEAHGGTISAGKCDTGGARVCFTLPLGEPPLIEDEVMTGTNT